MRLAGRMGPDTGAGRPDRAALEGVVPGPGDRVPAVGRRGPAQPRPGAHLHPRPALTTGEARSRASLLRSARPNATVVTTRRAGRWHRGRGAAWTAAACDPGR